MMLCNSDKPRTTDMICTFHGMKIDVGGSACNTSRCLKRILKLGGSQADAHLKVGIWTVIGHDRFGNEMMDIMGKYAVDTELVVRSHEHPTAVSILPVYKQEDGGGRGCFVDLGTNHIISMSTLFELPNATKDHGERARSERMNKIAHYDILHIGYPHLLPKLQGKALGEFLGTIRDETQTTEPPRSIPYNQIVFSMDVNGANDPDPSILAEALPHLGIFHANLEEGYLIVNKKRMSEEEEVSIEQVEHIIDYFLDQGVALVAITLGKDGAMLGVHPDRRVLQQNLGQFYDFIDFPETKFTSHAAFEPRGEINATGAGDAFTAGIIAAVFESKRRKHTSANDILKMGLAAALFQIDTVRNSDLEASTQWSDAVQFMEYVLAQDFPCVSSTILQKQGKSLNLSVSGNQSLISPIP